MVAAILHLGNIDFGKGEESDSSVIKDENSRFHLNLAAELLRLEIAPSFLTIFETVCPFLVQWNIRGKSCSTVHLFFDRCNAQSLEDALIRRVMVTPEEIITKTLDPDNAIASRDTLAKTIYSHLFDW